MAEATIRDVARRAQVSIATVSRALNGLENVSEETRVKVRTAVAELGYVPHAGARSLSLARAHAIGVVLPDLHGEFFSEIMRGMDREASRHKYLLLLSNLHAGSTQSEVAVRAMRGRVDGLIVMAPHLDRSALERVLPTGLPAVLLNTPLDLGNFASLRLDNAAGVDALVEHLVASGRRRIVHISGPPENTDAQERQAAFEQAIARLLPGSEARVVTGDFTEDGGQRIARDLVAEGADFDAIFAANDMMATGCLLAFKECGIAVPERIAVAGFDDIPLARFVGLTTVRVRIAELGEAAIARLVGLLDGGGIAAEEYHRPELVIRATTGPAA
jgi:LacI family transcriptional regulator